MSLISGAQLRAARAMLRWEQLELAKISGVSGNTIRKLEHRELLNVERLSTLRALQHAFEEHGVVFTDNGEPGVKLRKASA
jgi:transcriptional regulator with XRE-family HTH domain